MMPVYHVQSRVYHITVLTNAGTSASNRMLTAGDLTVTGVIVNKHFLNVTYSPLKHDHENIYLHIFLYTVISVTLSQNA